MAKFYTWRHWSTAFSRSDGPTVQLPYRKLRCPDALQRFGLARGGVRSRAWAVIAQS
jgi:hypothetical protein